MRKRKRRWHTSTDGKERVTHSYTKTGAVTGVCKESSRVQGGQLTLPGGVKGSSTSLQGPDHEDEVIQAGAPDTHRISDGSEARV